MKFKKYSLIKFEFRNNDSDGFLEFRDYLFPSSGFQSAQFRLIENKLGLPVNRRLKYGIQDYKNVLAIDQKN